MPEINQDIALDDIIIDEELKYLLPQLSEETFAALEANILEHGLRDALVLWEGEEGSILIDGHNRYEVIKKHDLPFSVVYMNFSSKDEVIVWMIKTQIARRNLTQMQHTLFRGMHYEAEKRIQGTQNQYVQKANSETESEKGHSDPFHSSTASRLGEKYKVSPRTIKRDAQAAAGIIAIGEVSSPAKIKVLEESTDITRKQLRDLATAKPDLIAEVATAIEAGTFERGSLTTALTPPSEENTDSSGSDSGSADTAGTGQPPSAQ
ncbi:MAG: hypothetical protein FWC86_04380, partial [Coriobacteriia bacterium]|nr:hypothetical protein [Coriobacteriia bacterium]